MNGGDEAGLLNRMARAYPSVTAVRVKDAIDIVSGLWARCSPPSAGRMC